MSFLKRKIPFPKLCEYAFNTWGQHYIPNREDYTRRAIEAAGVTFKPTKDQLDFLWTQLEYYYVDLIVVYAYEYFGGKYESEQISYAVSKQYAEFLLTELRKQDKETAGKTLDGVVDFIDAISAKLESTGWEDTPMSVTDMVNKVAVPFAGMVLYDRITQKMPELKNVILQLAVNTAMASAQAGFRIGKVTWN